MNELVTSVVTILTAIIGVAILAVLVSRNSQTPAVIGAAASGFAKDLGAAVSPITGGSSFADYGGMSGGYPSFSQ